MGWIATTVFCILLALAGIGYVVYSKATWKAKVESYGSGATDYSLIGWAVVGIAAIVFVGATGFKVAHTVGQREVAVVYSFSGTITGKRDPGVVWTAPWQHIKKENVGILHDEWNFDQGNFAVSKDQQRISALLAVNYQIEAKNVVDLYKRVGPAWKTIIIDSRVPQVFKEVTSKYPTQQITASREQLRIDTKNRLIDELAPYDIHVVDVFVKNLGFSEEYTAAIEAKQKQVQDAQRAQAKIIQVQAEAAQRVAAADGEAKANIARARGDATANKLRQRSLTQQLIQWEAIQKLNPNVSLVYCSTNVVCVPNAGPIVPATKAP